jgi:hypothetical protein
VEEFGRRVDNVPGRNREHVAQPASCPRVYILKIDTVPTEGGGKSDRSSTSERIANEHGGRISPLSRYGVDHASHDG